LLEIVKVAKIIIGAWLGAFFKVIKVVTKGLVLVIIFVIGVIIFILLIVVRIFICYFESILRSRMACQKRANLPT